MSLSGLLWVLLVILLVAWLFGFAFASVGSVIHILLVLAVIILLYNLLVGGRTAL